MELKNIETFLKVAANQNLSKTAEQMGYSQSALTIQIQKLEKELGVQLFERIGKRIFLTEKGEGFLPYANDLLKALDAAMEYSQGEKPLSGTLRIGGVESICTAILPKLLPKFYESCPDVKVVVRSGYTSDLLNLLDSNDLDLVFTLDEKIKRKQLICHFQKEEPMVFVSRFVNSSKTAAVTANELAKLPFILPEAKAPYRRRFEEILADDELFIRPILEIGNTETIINLLKNSMGVSLLPRFTVLEETAKHRLMELKTDIPPIRMYSQLFCHKGKWITPQLQVFMDLVSKYFSL